MMLTEEKDDLGPFKDADSTSAIMAYVHAKFGEQGLRRLLTEITADRESLERDANELAEVGLPEVAAIVMEAAANATPAHVMHCPYEESDRHNYESWQASYQRRLVISFSNNLGRIELAGHGHCWAGKLIWLAGPPEF